MPQPALQLSLFDESSRRILAAGGFVAGMKAAMRAVVSESGLSREQVVDAMNEIVRATGKGLTAQLARHEGTKRDQDGLHVAYRCTAGALTIGYGHNLEAKPVPGVTAQSRLNEDQARRLLEIDIREAEHQLRQTLMWTHSLDPVRYAVLVNMAFNMGINGLLGFRNTLADVERGDYAAASRRMLQSKWARQVGNRARELSEQMRTGQWA